jgi:hypothetical protein
MCSNRAATWVTLLKAREKQSRKNHRFCSYFANSGKVQQGLAPPLHGGGQGFESPRLHSKISTFAGETLNTDERYIEYREASWSNGSKFFEHVRMYDRRFVAWG